MEPLEEETQNSELDFGRQNFRLIVPDNETLEELGPILGYAQEPLVPLVEACEPLVSLIFEIMEYVALALQETPNNPHDGLTRDESAAIRLYTMEWHGGHRSLYSNLNETLRHSPREHLEPWFKYLKLLLTGLAKISCASARTLWRGIRQDISNEFPPGKKTIWWCFSSCTKNLAVLKSDLYLGQHGPRTLFSIETVNARNVKNPSHFVNEEELLLLPGTYVEVESQLNPALDFHVIHLKQLLPQKILLELPFEGMFRSCKIVLEKLQYVSMRLISNSLVSISLFGLLTI